MKYAVPALALLVLAACDDPAGLPAGAEAVPFAQVLEETAGRPWECVAYDPVSRSCEALGTTRVEAAGFRAEATLLISGDPRAELRVSGLGVPDGNRTCTDPSTYSFTLTGSGATPFMRELLVAEFESEGARQGTLCTTYIRAGGGYIVQTTDVAGRPVDGYVDQVVTFLADRPALRVPSLTE